MHIHTYMRTMSFQPNFTITPAISKALMRIEADRKMVTNMHVSTQILHSLRESARLTATHYSTQIEGNRLSQEEVAVVVQGGTFPHRERDEQEVKNYYQALEYVDLLIKHQHHVTDAEIQTIHGLVYEGKQKVSPYRDGQNVIRDGRSGAIVYLPPEAKDVPTLMQTLIAWLQNTMRDNTLPVPIIAAITHYQFATIHPYFDGNGRTARLLTNLVLHLSDYGMNGIYTLEEYYAKHLTAYYEALTVGPSHNYYFGRAEADITAWIHYFCEGMAEAFSSIKTHIVSFNEPTHHTPNQDALRWLDQRQKLVLMLFKKQAMVSTKDIATQLHLHPRSALNYCKKWCEEGFLIQHGTANKNRHYTLAEKWHGLSSR